MKKNIAYIILSVFFITILIYVNFNSFTSSFLPHKLPYGLMPVQSHSYPQNFVLKDANGFEVTGVGFRHSQSSFEIKDFLSFGYNENSIVLVCLDSLKNIKFLKSFETGDRDEGGNSVVSFEDIDSTQFNIIKSNYNLVSISEEKSNTIRFLRLVVNAIIIFAICIIIVKWFYLLYGNKL
jgi:hypothetical protein